jgi:hypothetical protein
MRVACGCFLPVALLVGCLQPEPPNLAAPAKGAPSETDFHWAMEASLQTQVDGRAVIMGHCDRGTGLQCTSMGHGNRYRCTYRYGGGRRGVAVVERQEGAFWRWITGPKQCRIVINDG